MLKPLTTAFGAAALALVTTGCQAADYRVVTGFDTVVTRPVQDVQYFYEDEDELYAPAPVYRPRYRVYREPPRHDYYAPRPVYRTPGPPYGYYDKEAAKDYVKSYRRTQKEIFKDNVRAWNRANGY